MKTPLLLAVLATTTLAQVPVQPQIAQPQPPRIRVVNPTQGAENAPAFPDNYLVALSVVEDGATVNELVITTARPLFEAETFDPAMTFSGTLALAEDGTVLVSYRLGAQIAVPVVPPPGGAPVPQSPGIQYKSQTAQAQVRLKLGEPLNVLRTGQRTYRLTVSKLETATKAK